MSQTSSSQALYASTSLLGGSSSAVRREVLGNSLTQWSDERISNHWRRNKRASIDLLELPVAVDRQLEDQRLIMARNRNPQLDVPTKVDKVRSEQIIAKIGATRSVAVKAAVLNKIVREATGINTYVITAPPRSGEDKPEDISDPDTNPHFKSYAKETKKKPQIVSFGHRPRSASRTFNPATMRIRMRHGEMANPGRDGQYGFGLPVGILAKILKAPKIANADPFKTSARNTPVGDQDVYDLFSLPGGGDEEEDFYEKEPVVGGGAFDSASELQESSLGMESWVSPTQQSLQMGKVRGGGVRKGQFSKAAGEPLTGNRRGRNPGNPTTTATDGDNATVNSQYYNKDLHPLPWDSAHHNVRLSHHELYDIKKNVMPNQNYSLTERMTRFSQKTIADEITPFCKEKQQLDMQILRAGPSAPPPNFDVSPPKGQPRFHDPNNLNLGYVIKRREELLQNMDRKKRSHNFQADLMTVPKVQYHPQSLNMQIQSGALALKDILQSVASIPPKDWEDFQPPSKLDRFLHEKSNTYQSALALKTNSLNALSLSKTPAFDQKSHRPAHGSSVTSQLVPSPSLSSTSPVLGIGGVVSDVEANLYLAMRRAKKGDKRALYHHFHTPEHRVEAQENSQLEQWHQESEEILATRAIDSIPLKEQQEQAEASVEALLQMAAENKARERAATAEARARREEELEQARLIEEQRQAEAALLEIQQAAARQKAADEAAAERQRVEQLKREREAAERAEAEARRSAAPTPQPPKPMISLIFASMRAWDLVNTGSAFDAQDPALRLFLEPGAKLIGKTLRQKDAGIQASFPESFSVDVFLDDYVAGSLELRAEVVSQDATGLINKHVGVGSVRMFSIFGQGLPQYQGEKIPVKATVTINLINTNKGIEKGHVELTCGVQVPKPDYQVSEEILQDPVFVAPSGLGLVCEENGRELERAQGQEQEQ